MGRNIIKHITSTLPKHSAIRVGLLAIAAEGVPPNYLKHEHAVSKSVLNRATNPKQEVSRQKSQENLLVKHRPHKRLGIIEEEIKYTAEWFKDMFTKEKSGVENDRVYFSHSQFDVELAYYGYGHAQILVKMATDAKVQEKIAMLRRSKPPTRFLKSFDNAPRRLELVKSASFLVSLNLIKTSSWMGYWLYQQQLQQHRLV